MQKKTKKQHQIKKKNLLILPIYLPIEKQVHTSLKNALFRILFEFHFEDVIRFSFETRSGSS